MRNHSNSNGTGLAAPETARPAFVISSFDEMERIRSRWQALTTDEAAPFQTYSWVRAWYRHFADSCDEMVVFVSRNELVIFPLYRKGNSLRLAGDLSCDFQDAIAKGPREVRNAFPELVAWAAKRNLDLDFKKLSSDGCLYPVVREMPRTRPYFDALQRTVGPCPFFEIPESSEAYLATLPRKFRAELRRQSRRIEADFPETKLQFRKSPLIDSRDVLKMMSFHRRNFYRTGTNPIEDFRFRNFLLEVNDEPEVGLCVSRLGNRETSLAMDLTFVRGERCYGYLTAFDREQARYSPGSCLLISRLDLLAEKGVRVFDFLCGSESYKYRFAREEYLVKSARFVRRNAAGTVRYLALRSLEALRPLAREVRGLLGTLMQRGK